MPYHILKRQTVFTCFLLCSVFLLPLVADPVFINGVLVKTVEKPPSSVDQLIVLDSIPASGGNYSMGLAFDGQHLWNDEAFRHWFGQIDSSSGAVVDSFQPTYGNRDMTFDGLFLWATDWQQENVYKYDTSTSAIVSSFPAPFGGKPNGMAWDGTDLWIGEENGQLWLIDTTGSVIRSIPAPNSSGSNPRGLAFDGTYLWVGAQTAGLIYEVDPSDGTVINTYTSPCANLQQGLTFDGTYLWATGGFNWIYKMDIGFVGILEVTDFFASPKEEYVLLQWRTEMERESYLWLIQRKDFEGEYSTITSVKAQGNISKPNRYEYRDRDIEFDKKYFYRLIEINVHGDSTYFGPLFVDLSQNPFVPGCLSIEQNYPNPFFTTTTIEFGIPLKQEDRSVHLSIHDCTGREIRNFSIAEYHPGYISIPWDGRNRDGMEVPGGIYFCQLIWGEEKVTKRMVKIK